jgi:hypothetical protein
MAKLKFLLAVFFVVSPLIAMEATSSAHKSENISENKIGDMERTLDTVDPIDKLYALAYEIHGKLFEKTYKQKKQDPVVRKLEKVLSRVSNCLNKNELKNHSKFAREKFAPVYYNPTYSDAVKKLLHSFEEQLEKISIARQDVVLIKPENPYQEFLQEDEA